MYVHIWVSLYMFTELDGFVITDCNHPKSAEDFVKTPPSLKVCVLVMKLCLYREKKYLFCLFIQKMNQEKHVKLGSAANGDVLSGN